MTTFQKRLLGVLKVVLTILVPPIAISNELIIGAAAVKNPEVVSKYIEAAGAAVETFVKVDR